MRKQVEMAFGKINTNAFTYLELLLAMAIMSVISASIYASLSISFKARESAEQATANIRKTQIVMNLIEQDLEVALPPVGILVGEFIGTDNYDDAGNNADMLSFYSSAHNPVEGEVSCDIQKIEFILDQSYKSESEAVLVRRITTNLLSLKESEPLEEVLSRKIKAFNLCYFDGIDWYDSWDSTTRENTLPLVVEITLELRCSDSIQNEGSTAEFSRKMLILCGANAANESAVNEKGI